MIDLPVTDRPAHRNAVLDGLAALRGDFPLEQRLRSATPALRRAYGQMLSQWLQAAPPSTSLYDRQLLDGLQALDAIVPETGHIGCYPFAAHDTGTRVELPAGRVHAMCAIDALAMARLAESVTVIESGCLHCHAPIAIRMEANGGLDHDQADRATVAWMTADTTQGACSIRLCRNIRFLCNHCTPPAGSRHYTLPQAAAIGNAFFAFQQTLLPGRNDAT